MKKATIVLVFLLTFIYSFSQTNPIISKTKEDYLHRSKHQKTVAWILLGGGLVLTGLGIGVATASGIDHALGDKDNNNLAANTLAVTGVLSTLGSIPVFISAAHNKHKAATLSFNIQRMPVSVQTNYSASKIQPALTCKISL